MRKYNNKISERANEHLNKREAVINARKKVIVITLVILASIGILLGTSMKVQASSDADIASYYKYYTSVQVKAGDTLWTIADEYIMNLNIDKREYIEEICKLNGICQDEIHAGNYIIVPYYSKELK